MKKSCQDIQNNELSREETISNFQQQKELKDQFKSNIDEILDYNLYKNDDLKQEDWQDRFQNWGYRQKYFTFFHSTIQSLIKKDTQIIDQSFLKNPQNFIYFYRKIEQKLLLQNFRINRKVEIKNDFRSHNFSIKVINTSRNNQVIQIFCQYGIYEKKYTILTSKQKSFRHQQCIIAFGGMGRVYCDSNHKKVYKTSIDPQIEVVSKCLQYSKLDFQHPILKTIIGQIFLTDMMSALQIGPKFIKSTGFDFIIFENCVEFEMEKCHKVRPQNLEKELKQNLFKMHLIKTIHSDIKPDNCMYSLAFKRNVLIDFGISQFLPYFLGSQVFSMFKGTYQYCCEDMKKIISKKNPELIDLYKNDVEMLEKSLKIIQKSMEFNQFTSLIEKNYRQVQLQSILQYSQIQSQQKSISLFSQSEQKSEWIQSLFKLKYELYFHQQKNRASNNLKQILIQVSGDTLNDEYNKFIAKQLVNFISKQLDRVQNCFNLLSTQCKILNISIFDSYLDMNYQVKIQDSQRSNKNVQNKFFENNEKIKRISTNTNLNQSFKRKKTIKQHDLEVILFNLNEIEKFSFEDIFELYLEYVSFWKSTYKVSIENKQEVSTVVRKFIQKFYKSTDFQYVKSKYLPEQPFIKTNCKNMVWIYGFLLTYCMQGENTRFKTDFLMLVLKDCILLNFKCFHFAQKCQARSIQRLIKQNNPSIMATVLVNKIQLAWLLSVSFAIFSQTQIQGVNGKKNLIYSYKQFDHYLNQTKLQTQEQKQLLDTIKRMFSQMIPFHLKHFHEKQVLIMKFSKFQNHFQTQFPDQTIIKKIQSSQIVRNLISVIEDQFQSLNNKIRNIQCNQKSETQNSFPQIDLALYKKAIYCITFASTFYGKPQQKPHKELSIFSFSHNQQYDSTLFQFFTKYNHLKQHLSHQLPKLQHLISQIDKKINCMPLARCIQIDLRIKVCVIYETFGQLMNLIKLITFNRWATITVNNGLLKGHTSYRHFFIFLQQNSDLKHKVMESDFLNILVENHLNMVEATMKEGNFFKLWTIFNQIFMLLILNQNYLNLPTLKKSFCRLKTIIAQDIPGLYLHYHLIEKSLSVTPLLGQQSFKLLQQIETLKIQMNLEKFYSDKYFLKVRKIFKIYQSLYQTNQGIVKIVPSFGGQNQYKYSFNSVLHTVIEIFNQSHHFDKILVKGWQNVIYSIQNYYFLFQPQVSESFHYLFLNIFASENYTILSQFLLVSIKEIMSFKIIATPYKGFNITLKAVIRSEKQRFIKFLDVFFRLLSCPQGKTFQERLCLCLFYISILGFTEYFGKNIQLWKKLLLLLYNHFSMYPKFEYEPQKLSQQRYHKIILLSIKYLSFMGKNRKRDIFIKEFVRKIQGQNQFYGEQAIEWIQKFISFDNTDQININTLKLQKKKLKYLSNVLLNSKNQQKTILKGTNLHKKLLKIFVTKQDASCQTAIESTISKTRLEKELKQKYNIPLLYPIFRIHADTLMTLVNFKDEPIIYQPHKNQAENQKIQKNKQANERQKTIPIHFKKPGLFKNFKHNSVQMQTFIQKLKKSQTYNLCNQITQLALNLIKQEKKWLKESKYKFVIRTEDEKVKSQLRYFLPFSKDNIYDQQAKKKYRKQQLQKFKRQLR